MFIQVEPVRASVLDVLVCCVDMVLNTEWVQIEAIDLTSDGSAWGFGITGGRSTGVVVKTIVPGSVADKDGRLQIGDHIIQIGDINLRGMGSEQVAMVLRQCGNQVHLIVARPVEPTSPEDSLMQSASAIIPTRVLNEPEELEQQLNVYQPGSNGYSDSMVPDMYSSDPAGLVDNQKDSCALRKRNEKVDMECFEVNLIKDHQGLGIIVAGYVCEREDISGIFVKSIAKGSVADLCGQIRVHDQVVEVDGHPLKGYSNCEAVEILRNTGKYVKLQLARYHHGSKFEHLQEAMGSDKLQYCNTSKKSVSSQPVDNAYTLANVEEVKAKWESVLGPKSEVIITELQKYDNEIGFGFNVETRCDAKSVLHHFISDICKGYSVDRSGAVFIGDELLEVNGHKLQGTKYSEVLSIFKSLPPNIVLVNGRSHHWTSNLSLIPWTDRLVKSKSDSYLLTRKRCESHEKNFNRRSLELLSSLATWSSEPHFIDLVKGDDGLGFSIMEYKDNLMPSIQDENVIIVWSLVPGAAAQLDGRLLPGDRLLSVNNINFRHTSFDMAQEVLKHVPKGVVRLGVAKPITLSKSVPAKISFKEPIEERNVFSNGTTLRVFEYNGVCHTYEEPNNLYTRSQTPSSLFSFGNDSRCSTPFSSPGYSGRGLWGFEIPVLPAALERIVKIKKGNNKLGLVLDLADRGQNGMIVKSIRPASAVEKDGNVQIGDYILGVNSENMRNITRSQARAIIRRAELTSSDIVIKYIPAADAAVHQQSAVLAKIHEGNVSPTPSIISRQPSPRVFPAYYRSPYFSHKSTKSTPDHEDADGQISPFSFLSEDDVLATPSSFYTDNFDSSSDDLLLDTPEANMNTEVFPSVGERILLFQSGKHPIHQMQVHQVHQVPSKYSRMSTSPTVSPVLVPSKHRRMSTSPTVSPAIGTWSDAHKQQNCEKEVFPSISEKISLFQAQGEQLNIPPRPIRRSSAPNFQGMNRPSSPTSYLYGLNRPGSPTYNSYRTGPPYRSAGYESPTGRKSPEFGSPSRSSPGSPKNYSRNFGPGSRNSAPPSPLMSPAGNQWGVTRTVSLFRQPGQEIGIGVVMGCVDSTDEEATPLSGIFIKHVVPDSIAGRLGTINRGDRIVAVNGVDLANMSYKDAVDTIAKSGNPMKLTLQSLVPWVPNNNNNANNAGSPRTTDSNKNKILDSNKNALNKNITNKTDKDNKDTKNTAKNTTTNKSAAQTSPNKNEPASPITTATNMHKEKLKQRTMSEDEEDDSQFQGKVFTAKGVEIDRKSAGFLKVADDTEEEDQFGYTQKKILRKYGDTRGGTPMLVEVERSAGGIGLSLAGNKDRNQMSSFICGLHPNRNAAKTGKFQVGDELLEVNGTVLVNRCHLNVSSIIRSIITPTCKFVICRHGNTENMAIKPITHFPVDAENEEMEQLISSYPGVRTVVATKEKTGLGIMIVEGSHSEIGRGVFIGDLTKDGPADKAGLMQNDMILAINRTKLVGADYDLASSVLKNEEGAITFYVLNANAPAKSEGKDNKESKPNATVRLDHVGTEIATEIKRADKTGLGISIVGGTDTPLGSIIIREIYKNGAADKNGKLQPGDQILEINGKDMRAAKHEEVVNLLRTPAPTVTIRVYRDRPDIKENLELVEATVEVTKKPGKGLGLNIVGLNNSKGVVISEILKDGPAEATGGLFVGDQILEANGKDLREATQEAAAAVLKTIPGKVTMKIGRIRCDKKPPPKRAMH